MKKFPQRIPAINNEAWKTEACYVASSLQENMCVTFSRWVAKNPMGRATGKKMCFSTGYFKKCLALNETIFLEQSVVVNKAARKIPDAFHENNVTCTWDLRKQQQWLKSSRNLQALMSGGGIWEFLQPSSIQWKCLTIHITSFEVSSSCI